jgi:hypothetical protein
MPDNRRQNRQFADAVRTIERRLGRRLRLEEQRRLHEAVTGQNLTFDELVELGLDLLG